MRAHERRLPRGSGERFEAAQIGQEHTTKVSYQRERIYFKKGVKFQTCPPERFEINVAYALCAKHRNVCEEV